MKSLVVPLCQTGDFTNCVKASADIFKWVDNTYTPKTEFHLCYNEKGLKVKVLSYEKETYVQTTKDNGMVCCDSCVEMFIRPFADDERYINFEINPAGATVMSVNKSINDGIVLVFKYKRYLDLITSTDKENGLWSVNFNIPFDMLCEIYGKTNHFKCGSIIHANFYKCGDQTPYPHYGMWNEIKSVVPNFHLPAYFGKLILG